MDARKKKVLTILCIGSVILVWRMYAVVTTYLLPSPAHADVGTSESLPAANLIALGGMDRDMANRLAEQDRISQQDWGRNPFSKVPWMRSSIDPGDAVVESIVNTPPSAPSILLTGVSKSDDKWLASVRDKIVRVGDVVDGAYRIVEIDRHSITLASRGWAYTYRMGSKEAHVRPLRKEPK
ncbi:MAG: hypothetical protein ACE5EC_08230 [Phycisphaerae bacterium]